MSCFIKYSILLSLLLFCVSCGTSPPKEIIAKSTIKLDCSNTTIRDLLEIDGYYVIGGLEAEITPTEDRRIFFGDGTYAFNFIFKRGLAIENIVWNLSESIRRVNYGSMGDLWAGHMGVYRIEGDMIIGHLYQPPYNTDFLYLGPGWGIWEEGYKIVNRTTLKRVYFRSLLKANKNTTLGKNQWVNDPPYIFISAKNLPSENWLKEEPWIWRNESDWRAYMEKIEGAAKSEVPSNKTKPPASKQKPSKHEPSTPSSIGGSK